MGFDILGTAPTTKEGFKFPCGRGTWHGLADYVLEIAPDITRACKHWHSNDYDGLDAAAASALADRVQAEIDAGRTLVYLERYMVRLDATPPEPCSICAGAGALRRLEGWGAVDDTLVCRTCGGSGRAEPVETDYPFHLADAERFAKFLRSSGGFAIW